MYPPNNSSPPSPDNATFTFFLVINDNKIILSRRIVKSEENKLSDSIIPVYKKIDKALNLTRNLTSLIVTKGPGSYTSLRVGISFILGLHFSKEIKIAGVSSEDLLNFEISNNQLFGDYNYVLEGVIYTGKLYDAKRVNNRLELVWEEKSGGKVYKGKLVIDIGIDWSEFNGIYYFNNGKIGGTWTGKLKNNKKSVIEYYLNLSN